MSFETYFNAYVRLHRGEKILLQGFRLNAENEVEIWCESGSCWLSAGFLPSNKYSALQAIGLRKRATDAEANEPVEWIERALNQ